MLKGRKKKNHGFRMMEREIKAWKRKMKRERQMKCSKECSEHFKDYPTHNICNSCPWVKSSLNARLRFTNIFITNVPA